ncbi:MAG: hypothetical protein ABL903_20760 [Methylococcales bacterium]
MNLDKIVQQSFIKPRFDKVAADAFCFQEGITIESYLDVFTKHVVKGYLDGRFSWNHCDCAMMGLSVWVTDLFNFDSFAWEIYMAFDAGEFHPQMPELTSDEVTRPLIHQLLLEFEITL